VCRLSFQKNFKAAGFFTSSKFLADYDASNISDDNFFCAKWKRFFAAPLNRLAFGKMIA